MEDLFSITVQIGSGAHPASYWFWGPPSLLFSKFRGYFPGLKHPGLDVDHSTSSSADGKNKWSHTSIPLLCLHGIGRKNFILFSIMCLLLLLLTLMWMQLVKLWSCSFFIRLSLLTVDIILCVWIVMRPNKDVIAP